MPDINGMAIFAKVVDANGFTQAARVTGLPKSTISRKVSQLEEQLGVRLLQRNNRGLSLTHAGELFYQHCAVIVQEVEEAKATIENTREDLSGALRIVLPVSFGQETVSKLCCGFLKKYPKVDLDIQFTDEAVNLVSEGYDIAIKYGPLENSDLIARLLLERQPILVASPKYLKKRGYPQKPQDLADHQGLLLGTSKATPIWPLGSGSKKTMVQFKKKVRVNSSLVIKQMALSGFGVAMLTQSQCVKELEKGELVVILDQWPIDHIRLYGVYPSRRQLAAKVSCFLDYFVKYFADHESNFSRL